MKICATCPRETSSGRHKFCDSCRAEPARRKARERKRDEPSAAVRGYGSQHQLIRRRWAEQVATGTICCARCGAIIEAGEPWDLGHHDLDRTKYTGPEHRRCNRATNAYVRPQSRAW